MLFDANIEKGFRQWKVRLRNLGFLFVAGAEGLTNTRYADDVRLYAKLKEEVVGRTEIGIEELANLGLQLNACKLKISTMHTTGYNVVETVGGVVNVPKGNDCLRLWEGICPGHYKCEEVLRKSIVYKQIG